MSVWSRRRKITIQLTIFTVFLIIISSAFFYYSYSPPSCFDGLQNQNERGIDCDGVCTNECRLTVDEVSILWARPFLVIKDTNTYVGAAYLSNQNTDLYARDVDYEFIFHDDKGKLIIRKTGKTAIMPFGITPVFSGFILGKERKIKSAAFRFTEDIDFIKVEDSVPTFRITSTSFSLGDKPSAKATVQNTSLIEANNFDFIVVIFDELNNAIATSRTFVKKLKPGEIKFITFSWPRKIQLNKKKCGEEMCDVEAVRIEVLPVFAEEI